MLFVQLLIKNWAYWHSSGSSWSWGSSRSLWTLLLQQKLHLMLSYFHFSNCFMLIRIFYTLLKQINFSMFTGAVTYRLSSVSLFSGLTDWTRSTRSAWSTRWSSRASITTITLQETSKRVGYIRERTIWYSRLCLAFGMWIHICSLCFQPWFL